MRQVIQHLGSGELEVAEVPPPRLQPPGVLVENECSLISVGTERSTVTAARKSLLGKALARPDQARKVLEKVATEGVRSTLNLVRNRLETPSELGYSSAGRVVAVGEEVTELTPGQRVACAGQGYASHADVVYVPRTLCVPIPEGVSAEDACYVALGSIALQSVRRAGVTLGEVVVVVGLGMLGQLTAQILRAAGCTVVGTDIDESSFMGTGSRRAHREVPLSDVVAEIEATTGGLGADAVILAASTASDGPVELAGRLARKRGVVVVLGAVGMDVPRDLYYRKELDLRLSTSYGPGRYDNSYEAKGRDYPAAYVRWTEQRNMSAFLQLVADNSVRPSDLTTHRYGIDEARQAYDLVVDGSQPHRGVIFRYRPPEESQEASSARNSATFSPRSTPDRLRVGVIGAGSHFQDRLLPALLAHGGVSVTSVCASRGPSARAAASKADAATATTSAEEVLRDPEVDAVIIATRHGSHAALALSALGAGKRVFLEKPLCTTEEELEELERVLLGSDDAFLMLGFNRRFSPHVQTVRTHLAERTSPLVMSYRVNAGIVAADHWIQDRQEGGGRVIGECCHFLDAMAALAGAPPVRTTALSVGHHPSGVVSDRCVISSQLSDGSVASLVYAAGDAASLGKERLEILGGDAAFVIDDFRETTKYGPGGRTRLQRGFAKGFEQEMAAFARACLEGGPSPTDPETVIAVTRATFDAMAAIRGEGGVST